MKKTALLLALIMIFSVCAVSCDDGGITTGGGSSGTKVVYNDVEYTLPETVDKVVSLSPAATLTIKGLSKHSKLIGVDAESASLLSEISNKTLDVTGIAALAPDVAFVPDGTDVSSVGTSTTVIKIPEITTVEGVKKLISMLSEVFSAPAAGESLKSDIDKKIEFARNISSESASYKAFVDLGEYKTSGSGTYISEILTTAGLTSIAGDKTGFVALTEAEIVAANPDYIFTTGAAADYIDNAAFAGVSAVVNKKVIELDISSIGYPSSQIAASIEIISNALEVESADEQ